MIPEGAVQVEQYCRKCGQVTTHFYDSHTHEMLCVPCVEFEEAILKEELRQEEETRAAFALLQRREEAKARARDLGKDL